MNMHLDVAKRGLDIAKYETYPDIDININDEYAFRWSCENGHLDVAKWLYEIKPIIDISADDEWAFRYSCSKRSVRCS